MGQKASACEGQIEGAAAAFHRARRRGALADRPGRADRPLSTGLATAPGLQCRAGFDGRIKQLSPAWAQTLGWSTRQLTSRPFMVFVHAQDRALLREQIDKLARGAGVVEFEQRKMLKESILFGLKLFSVQTIHGDDQFQPDR